MEQIEQKEFKIKSREEIYRLGYISPVDLLAISTQLDFENFKMTKTLVQFSLEHCEVKIGEAWVPVKTKDKEIYYPKDIINDFVALNEIFQWVVDNIIIKVFPRSSESTMKTE